MTARGNMIRSQNSVDVEREKRLAAHRSKPDPEVRIRKLEGMVAVYRERVEELETRLARYEVRA